MRHAWMRWLMVVLGMAGLWPMRGLAEPASQKPRLLFQEVTGGQSGRRYVVELPQPDGSLRLARLERCTSEEEVRTLFGLFQLPLVQIGSGDERLSAPSTPVLSCPDGLPDDAPVFVETSGQGVSFLQASANRVLVIPNRCTSLIHHFRIPTRAGQQVRPGPPAPEAEHLFLSCGNEKPGRPYTGWQVHRARVDGVGGDKLVLLRKGAVSITLEAVDGHSFNAEDSDTWETALARLRELFSVPSEVETQDVFLRTEPLAPELQQPLFDLCLDTCADPRWSPAHKRFVDGAFTCLSGKLEPDGTCSGSERLAFTEQRQLDGSTRKLAARVGLELPACGTEETWEKRLGLARTEEQGPWMTTLEARFLGSPPKEGAPAALKLPCVKEPPTCQLKLRDSEDLSALSLKAAVKRSCKPGDEVLELVFAKLARVSRHPLVVNQEELPPTMKTVRLIGLPGTSSMVQVAPPRCGADTCTQAQPALLFRGDLDVELSSLKLLPAPLDTAAPAAPPARIGIQAEGGVAKHLTLRLRDVDIGEKEQTPFYKGLRFSGGSLVLFNTNVRAFTDALTAEQARVSITSSRVHEHELASLVHKSVEPKNLKDLEDRPLASSVAHFRALALGARTQVFLAGMSVRGPMNVSWVDDRTAPGEEGLLSVQTRFTNGSGLFHRESVMLSVQGRGRLLFKRPDIRGVANVLQCASRPFASQPELKPEVVLDVPAFGDDILFKVRRGICDFQSPWEPIPPPETGS